MDRVTIFLLVLVLSRPFTAAAEDAESVEGVVQDVAIARQADGAQRPGAQEEAEPGQNSAPDGQISTRDNLADDRRVVDRYLSLIESVELAEGAYSAGLSEPLLGLGLALHERGMYTDAISMFKRGTHLARINDGLYGTTQLPHLEAEIASHIAAGNFAEADDRQAYLYRVQQRTLTDADQLATALLRQAEWQFQAYRLGLDDPLERLSRMYNLYELAHVNTIADESSRASELLPPLEGLLRTRYLITDFGGSQDNQLFFTDDFQQQQRQRQLSAMMRRNYEEGIRILNAMYFTRQERADENSLPQDPALALAQLGDWHLYHGRKPAALSAYADAHKELALLDDAKQEVARIFAEPVALPDLDSLRDLPVPVERDSGNVLVSFSVSSAGRVYDVDRLDDNDALDGRANRLLRKLRKTPFRPRFENGQPVQTLDIVHAYRLE